MATHDDFDITSGDLARLNKMISDATAKERQRCLDIVVAASLQVNSPHAQHVLGEVAHRIEKVEP